MNLVHTIRDSLLSGLHKAYSGFLLDDIYVYRTTEKKFGDYQTNAPLQLSKKANLNPREMAQKIIDYSDVDKFAEKIEVGGPGFINIFLKRQFLLDQFFEFLKDGRFGVLAVGTGKKVIVDFSGPNLAKEMHVGHLRSTIIGDSISRILEFLGYEVQRISHVGDWGTQYGMLITNLRDTFPQIEKLAQTDIADIEKFYKESKLRFDADENFKTRSRQEVVQLQSGNEDSLRAWRILCDLSRNVNQKMYDLLDIELTEKGESFYNSYLPDVIAAFLNSGLCEDSDGARCIFLEGYKNKDGDPLPLIIQKSDGGYNYAATDLAAIRYRLEDEKAHWIIYVVDAGQGTHFQMVFDAAEKIGWLDRKKHRVDHVAFGLVLGEDRKRFRSRSSETVKLSMLLNESIEKARSVVEEKSPEYEPAEKEAIARIIGIAAIKYADLSQNRTTDYVFSFEKMMSLNGNTAPYLLYTYVRVMGIYRKAGGTPDLCGRVLYKETEEMELVLHLLQFNEVLDHISRDLMINSLADYLYQLSQKFASFYQKHRIVDTPETPARLMLCKAVADVMKLGLSLLGINVLEKM